MAAKSVMPVDNNQMKSQRTIVGTGLIGLDVLMSEDGDMLSSALGGSAGNVLSILASLGWRSIPVTLMGNDIASEILMHELNASRIDTSFIVRDDAFRTPIIYQHQLGKFKEATHRFSFSCPRCGVKHKPEFQYGVELFRDQINCLPDSSVTYLDRPTNLGLYLAENCRKAGGIVIFEPSSIGDDASLFQNIIEYTHILKYSNDRIHDVDDFDLTSVSAEIVTLGSKGLKLRCANDPEGWRILPAFYLPEIEDTSGAGDWCTAGLIYSLNTQCSQLSNRFSPDQLVRALSFGQVLSSINCLTPGARGLLSSLPPVAFVELAELYSNNRLMEQSYQSDSFSDVSQHESLHDLFNRETNKYHESIKETPFAPMICCA